jgi:hypothetical protein
LPHRIELILSPKTLAAQATEIDIKCGGIPKGRKEPTMADESVDPRKGREALIDCLSREDRHTSIHLARLVEADTKGALQPFADALAARLADHLNRYAELGVTDPYITLEDEVYQLIKSAAEDWDGTPKTGRSGEEA